MWARHPAGAPGARKLRSQTINARSACMEGLSGRGLTASIKLLKHAVAVQGGGVSNSPSLDTPGRHRVSRALRAFPRNAYLHLHCASVQYPTIEHRKGMQLGYWTLRDVTERPGSRYQIPPPWTAAHSPLHPWRASGSFFLNHCSNNFKPLFNQKPGTHPKPALRLYHKEAARLNSN